MKNCKKGISSMQLFLTAIVLIVLYFMIGQLWSMFKG